MHADESNGTIEEVGADGAWVPTLILQLGELGGLGIRHATLTPKWLELMAADLEVAGESAMAAHLRSLLSQSGLTTKDKDNG